MDNYKVTRGTEIEMNYIRNEFKEIRQAWETGYAPIEIYKRFISYVLFGYFDVKYDFEKPIVERYYNRFIDSGELVLNESGEYAIFLG